MITSIPFLPSWSDRGALGSERMRRSRRERGELQLRHPLQRVGPSGVVSFRNIRLKNLANLALGKPATATSSEDASRGASAAVDGSLATRWSSAFSDPQSIQVDLGSVQAVDRVRPNWEKAYASAYQVQVSQDGSSWTTVRSVTAGDGGVDDLTGLNARGRYVKILSTTRATAYGYSLFELAVFS